MIEQYAPAIIAISATLNALWLLGAVLTTRRSTRRWLWRAPALMIAALAIVWTARMTTITPRPSHTLRALDRAIDLDLGALAWHVMLPIALLAMALRGVVVVLRRKPKQP
ncbi:MAG: hypothetical protein NXI14_04895 [bacterium]|nr:hypothetical protein [bacterium]